jgi:hypothetical protein
VDVYVCSSTFTSALPLISLLLRSRSSVRPFLKLCEDRSVPLEAPRCVVSVGSEERRCYGLVVAHLRPRPSFGAPVGAVSSIDNQSDVQPDTKMPTVYQKPQGRAHHTGVAATDWGRERGAAALGIDKQASTSVKLPRYAEDVRVHRTPRDRPLRLARLEHHVVASVAGLGVLSILHRGWYPLNAGGLEANASRRTTASFATSGGPIRSSASLRWLSSLRDRRSTEPWTDESRTRNGNWQLTPICVASTTPPTAAPRSIVFEPRWQLPC